MYGIHLIDDIGTLQAADEDDKEENPKKRGRPKVNKVIVFSFPILCYTHSFYQDDDNDDKPAKKKSVVKKKVVVRPFFPPLNHASYLPESIFHLTFVSF